MYISVSSGDDATPETRNILNVVSQLEKDEEVARQLQVSLCSSSSTGEVIGDIWKIPTLKPLYLGM